MTKQNEQVLKGQQGFNKGSNICHESPRRRGEEDGAKEALEEIMAENFLFLAKSMNLQIQKADL